MSRLHIYLLILLLLTGCGVSTKPADTHAHVGYGGPQKAMVNQPTVLFVGDNLTWTWLNYVQANHPNWINGAINAPATSGQILEGVPALLAQHPEAQIIHILAGSYDAQTAGWTPPLGGPTPDIATATNINAMIEDAEEGPPYARLAILGTLPPVADPTVSATILDLDGDILFPLVYEPDNPEVFRFTYPADYRNPPPGWTDYGTLPNQAGANWMTQQAMAAIAQVREDWGVR